jgi:hypothetical protein
MGLAESFTSDGKSGRNVSERLGGPNFSNAEAAWRGSKFKATASRLVHKNCECLRLSFVTSVLLCGALLLRRVELCVVELDVLLYLVDLATPDSAREGPVDQKGLFDSVNRSIVLIIRLQWKLT